MQVRFDGLLGFPGGLVEPGEDPLDGAIREMEEEVGLHHKDNKMTNENHITSFLNEKKKLVLHFYGLEVSIAEFRNIEKNNLDAEEYGIEVKLFTYKCMYAMLK